MAKRSRRPSVRGDDKDTKIELTPMIDVTFLILIFFMCTLQFKTLEGKLTAFLPTDKGLAPDRAHVDLEKARLVLRVHPADKNLKSHLRRVQVLVGSSSVPLGVLIPQGKTLKAQPANVWALVRKYTDNVRRVNIQAPAILEARPEIPHAAAVLALDKLHASGFEQISFAGIPPRLIQDLLTK